MAENLGKWPSKRGPISKIRPSDGCKGDTVPFAVERWYVFPNLEVIWEMSVYRIGVNEGVRNFFERHVPRTWVMGARAFVDQIGVSGEPSKEPAKLKHSEEDLELARQRLATSCESFRALFDRYPVQTGDGAEFKLRAAPAFTTA